MHVTRLFRKERRREATASAETAALVVCSFSDVSKKQRVMYMQITAITFMQTDKGTTKKKKDETRQDRRPLFPNLKASTDPQTNAALSHRKKKNRLSFNPPLSLLALLPSCALPGGCAALVPPGWAVRRAHGLWAKLDGPSRRGQENPPALSPPPPLLLLSLLKAPWRAEARQETDVLNTNLGKIPPNAIQCRRCRAIGSFVAFLE